MSSEPGETQDQMVPPLASSGLLGPFVATVGMVAIVAVAIAFRSSPVQAYLLAAMVAVSTWLSVIDFREHRLPNRIVGPLALAVVTSVLVGGFLNEDLGRSGRALGFGAATVAVLLVANIFAGLGMGDVKYGLPMATTVGWFGWDALYTAVMITTVTAAAVAITMLLRGEGREQQLAYGPYMALGMVAALLTTAPW